MNVELIGMTQPVIPEVKNARDMLSYCARVSSTANQLNFDSGPKLIRFLTRRREWSPLEMLSLTISIDTTRDIARQILRHRSFSFQEYSQRYAVADGDPVFREARLQDTKDRQNSVEVNDQSLETQWQNVQSRIWAYVQDGYAWALTNGIAKEVARAVLPEGMTKSKLYMAGTLRSWVHYCNLRCEKKTQKEHREIAEAIRDIIVGEFPDLHDVLFPKSRKERFREILQGWLDLPSSQNMSVDELAGKLEEVDG